WSSAHPVFAGLTPQVTTPDSLPRRTPIRAPRAAYSTVPMILVGSLAAMTLNLAGPVEQAHAQPIAKPRGAASELGRTILGAMEAARTALRSSVAASDTSATAGSAAAPAMYQVIAGDTVSDIAGRFGLATASVLALNGLGWSSLIFPGQELKLTTSGPVPPVAVADEPASVGRYTIVAGDTMSAIADRFGVSTLSLLTANGLGWSSIIYPGQTIAIPSLVGPGMTDEVARGATGSAQPELIPMTPVVDATPIEAPPAPAPAPAEAEPVGSSYTVVSGDTLSSIAVRYGVTTQALFDANTLGWESVIYPGTVLVIPAGSTTAGLGGSITGLTDEMRTNATIIVQVGRELGVPDYGIVIALAAAMQESSLRNLSWGDRDSVGLFQQRPSSGWGSVEQLTDPYYASRLFFGGPSNPNRGYTRGLLDLSGWQSMSVTQAAQAVQISAYPDAYAKWESSARSWFAQLA
ncbi:MAG: LysM peptidoglycan-binding domain-containing protein, partial [Rhodoglobus sp.]|nr:LysM peptidoglycan-binding domain-containing protein [Rhodoglobus sp.]